MKYLGIDYGTKRIGIALSDDGGEFAFPKGIITVTDPLRHSSSEASAIAEIAALCEKESVGAIVIGKSVASNGVENEIVTQVEKFKEKLAAAIKLPIFFQQEGFSTMEAHRYQTTAGSRDDSAAAIILQRFLASARHSFSEGGQEV